MKGDDTMVNFKDGELVKGAYVIIDGKEYEVHMPQYSGETPLSSENLNKMQKDLQDKMTGGVWMPSLQTLDGDTLTVEYLIKKGLYKRIGDLVYIEFYIRGRITALGTTEPYGVVAGLPYVAHNQGYFGSECFSSVSFNITDSTDDILLMPVPDEDKLRLQVNKGSTACSIKATTITGGVNYFELGGSGWYKANE